MPWEAAHAGQSRNRMNMARFMDWPGSSPGGIADDPVLDGGADGRVSRGRGLDLGIELGQVHLAEIQDYNCSGVKPEQSGDLAPPQLLPIWPRPCSLMILASRN